MSDFSAGQSATLYIPNTHTDCSENTILHTRQNIPKFWWNKADRVTEGAVFFQRLEAIDEDQHSKGNIFKINFFIVAVNTIYNNLSNTLGNN